MINESFEIIFGISDAYNLGWNEATAAQLLSDYTQRAPNGVSLEDYIEGVAQGEVWECRELSDQKPDLILGAPGAKVEAYDFVPQAVVDEAGGGIIIQLPGGNQYLVIPSVQESPEGVAEVHIYDLDGQEVVMWASDEWGEDPVLVMGALWGAITNPTDIRLS